MYYIFSKKQSLLSNLFDYYFINELREFLHRLTMDFKKKVFSEELNNILSYIEDILVTEFPTEVISPEYLVLGIMDVKNSHANLILENCLMSSSIDKLKQAYTSLLKSRTNKNASVDKSKLKYSEQSVAIMDAACEEAKQLSASKVSSEHLLLAMADEQKSKGTAEVFKTVGLKYEFIKPKCKDSANDEQKSEPKRKKKQAPTKKTEIGANGPSEKYEYISTFTTNISELVRCGQIDPMIGRERELKDIFNVMAKRRKNNVLLVGKSGCGLTHMVYGLAMAIESGDAPSFLVGKDIVRLDVTKLVAGSNFRGMLEERVNGLFSDLKKSKKHILFLDDMHNMMKNGGKDKDTDISDTIAEILSEGSVPVIGTTTFKDYRKAFEGNDQISRKMQRINLDAPSKEESVRIINGIKSYYEEYHGVKYSDEAIETAVRLSDRYITDRSLPDSAIDVIDTAGALAKIDSGTEVELSKLNRNLKSISDLKTNATENGNFKEADTLTAKENEVKKKIAEAKREKEKTDARVDINEDDIMSVISEMTSIPVNRLGADDKKKVLEINKILKESVIGQDEAVDEVSKVIKRNRVGLGDKTKTLANLLLVGPSGSGKSLIAKKLAEQLFGSENELVRIDMSEYSEKHSVSKLTGAAPGYVGYENGGQLTEAIKNKPHCVLLLDEVEKADSEVYNIFLQMFDDGRLTDSSGQLVNFKNVLVIMTSNLGARQAQEMGTGIGFTPDSSANKKSIIDKAIKKKFPPEFINRIDKIIHFNYLSNENLKEIVKIEARKIEKRSDEIGYPLKIDDTAIDAIHGEIVKDKEFGARPIIRILQEKVEDRLADTILEGDFEKGQKFIARCASGEITVEPEKAIEEKVPVMAKLYSQK